MPRAKKVPVLCVLTYHSFGCRQKRGSTYCTSMYTFTAKTSPLPRPRAGVKTKPSFLKFHFFNFQFSFRNILFSNLSPTYHLDVVSVRPNLLPFEGLEVSRAVFRPVRIAPEAHGHGRERRSASTGSTTTRGCGTRSGTQRDNVVSEKIGERPAFLPRIWVSPVCRRREECARTSPNTHVHDFSPRKNCDRAILQPRSRQATCAPPPPPPLQTFWLEKIPENFPPHPTFLTYTPTPPFPPLLPLSKTRRNSSHRSRPHSPHHHRHRHDCCMRRRPYPTQGTGDARHALEGSDYRARNSPECLCRQRWRLSEHRVSRPSVGRIDAGGDGRGVGRSLSG